MHHFGVCLVLDSSLVGTYEDSLFATPFLPRIRSLSTVDTANSILN